MNDIHVYSIWTYEKKISHDYYCQIMTHEVYNVIGLFKPNLGMKYVTFKFYYCFYLLHKQVILVRQLNVVSKID
jgi:hypothetical protein